MICYKACFEYPLQENKSALVEPLPPLQKGRKKANNLKPSCSSNVQQGLASKTRTKSRTSSPIPSISMTLLGTCSTSLWRSQRSSTSQCARSQLQSALLWKSSQSPSRIRTHSIVRLIFTEFWMNSSLTGGSVWASCSQNFSVFSQSLWISVTSIRTYSSRQLRKCYSTCSAWSPLITYLRSLRTISTSKELMSISSIRSNFSKMF